MGPVFEVLETLPDEVRVVRRRYARNVLIPTYSSLVVRLGAVAKEKHADYGDPAQLGEQNGAGDDDLRAEGDGRERQVSDGGGHAEPSQPNWHQPPAGKGSESAHE